VAGFTALPVTDRQLRYERDWGIVSLRAAVAEGALGGTAVAAVTL